MAEAIGPFTHLEIEDLRKEAERCQFQRGSQGVWARKVLRLLASYDLRTANVARTSASLSRSSR